MAVSAGQVAVEFRVERFGEPQRGERHVHATFAGCGGFRRKRRPVERGDVPDVVVPPVGFLRLAHDEQRHEMRALPLSQARIGTFPHPPEFRRLRRAPVLAVVPHLLRVEEFVLVLAGRVFHEDRHSARLLVEQVPAHVLRCVLLPPSAQPHDVRHRVFAFVQECTVERAPVRARLPEQVVAVGESGAQRVREEDAERPVVGEHCGERCVQAVRGFAAADGDVRRVDQRLPAEAFAVRSGEVRVVEHADRGVELHVGQVGLREVRADRVDERTAADRRGRRPGCAVRSGVARALVREPAQPIEDNELVRPDARQQQFRRHLEDRVLDLAHRFQLVRKRRLLALAGLAAAEALLARPHEVEIVAALRCQRVRQRGVVVV